MQPPEVEMKLFAGLLCTADIVFAFYIWTLLDMHLFFFSPFDNLTMQTLSLSLNVGYKDFV